MSFWVRAMVIVKSMRCCIIRPVESSVLITTIHVNVHDISPIVHGGYLEQGDHSPWQRSEMPWVVLAEDEHTSYGEQVDDKEEQEQDVSDGLQASY